MKTEFYIKAKKDGSAENVIGVQFNSTFITVVTPSISVRFDKDGEAFTNDYFDLCEGVAVMAAPVEEVPAPAAVETATETTEEVPAASTGEEATN